MIRTCIPLCRNDKQCQFVNKLLVKRPVTIPYENILNNIFTHYFVGYTFIRILLGIKIVININNIILFLTGIILGFISADIFSYIVHMFIDSKLWRKINNVEKNGRCIVNMHHDYTMIYSYLNSTELVCTTYPIVVPYAVISSLYKLTHPVLIGFNISFIVFGITTAHSHKWAHERLHNIPLNIIICKLQDIGLLLNPKSHQKHHIIENDEERENFSLSSGISEKYMNFFLSYYRLYYA